METLYYYVGNTLVTGTQRDEIILFSIILLGVLLVALIFSIADLVVFIKIYINDKKEEQRELEEQKRKELYHKKLKLYLTNLLNE